MLRLTSNQLNENKILFNPDTAKMTCHSINMQEHAALFLKYYEMFI